MADDTKTAAPAADAEDKPGTEDSGTPVAASVAASADEPVSGADTSTDSSGEESNDRPSFAEVDFEQTDLRPDGLDPDLMALPRKRSVRIGPVMSLSVLVFCVYIAFRVYPDLQFSRSAEQPLHFESVSQLLDQAGIEQLVSVTAVPDRSFAVHVSHSQADDGWRLTPVQGSDGRLWLMIGGNVWNTGIDYRELYAGRLRKLSSMPFYTEMLEHVRKRAPGPRFVRPEQLRKALSSPDIRQLSSPDGDTIAINPKTPVQIYETLTDRVRIHIFPTERMPKKTDLTGALQAVGLVPAGVEPERGLADSWIFVVDVPGGVNAARARLTEAKLFSARCTSVKRFHENTVENLRSDGQLLMLGPNPVLWSNVTWVSVEVPRTVPNDALVLVTLEHPTNYWYVLPLFVILALASLFFLYTLFRAIRPG